MKLGWSIMILPGSRGSRKLNVRKSECTGVGEGW